MHWNLDEAITYYKQQGAPSDQNALISLLKEIQVQHGGGIPGYIPAYVAACCGVKESLLLTLIKRIPSLRLSDSHCLEMCSGPNCGKHTALADFAQQLHENSGKRSELKFIPCMRMCGKGPNIKWDGKLYNHASCKLLEELITAIEK